MNVQPTAEHPTVEILSLYATGDLPFLLRIRTGQHVKECAACEQQVLSLQSAKAELRREAQGEILTGFEAIADWHSLESNMLGNIRVGVAASRCIENVGRTRNWTARLAWGLGMAALFIAGWMARIPAEDNQRIISALRRAVGLEQAPFNGTIVRSTPEGIAVRAQGATLTILHPHSAVVSMSGPSSVTARYVDDDSGQVTITNVYGQ
jgi:hypothetical protein